MSKNKWPDNFSDTLGKTTAFACRKHHLKVRKGSTIPYMSHLFAVASMVYEMQGSPEQVQAALLHDVIEDTPTTADEITKHFGKRVSKFVLACSDSTFTDKKNHPKKTSWDQRKQKTIAKTKKAPMQVLIILLSDKLHNARCMDRDLTAEGNRVWRRFSASPEKIANYYLKLAQGFQKRKKKSMPVFGAYADELLLLAKRIRSCAQKQS